LAGLLAARLCHDLGSPVATLAAMQGEVGAGAAPILKETTVELTERLKLYHNAFGLGDDADWAEVAALLRGAPMAHRVRFEVAAGDGPMPAARVRLALVAALQAAEALPRGGLVRLSALGDGLAAQPEGRDAAWPPPVVALAAGGSMDEALSLGARRVLAPWLFSLAAAEGMRVELAMGMGGGVAPLLIVPA